MKARSAFPPAPRANRNQSAFAIRGMHLNGWAFGYPYTFRCWTEADWRRYIDLLAAQRANLLFLWPFMEIIPLPLSAADRSYLAEVRRVVAYAQRQHGMEVWILQSANRVALNDCGVRDPRRRPYWVMKPQGDYPAAGQADLDPADPKQFTRIMKSREALYRLVDNADGYCTIDSDPGGWKGSPFSDYLKIFKASRILLDRHTVRGRRAKLINWLWFGWSHCWALQRTWWQPGADQRPLQAAVAKSIRAMKAALPEPWWLIAGWPEYLPACATEGVLGKTVYLPYNAIEGEPSRPGTQIDFSLQRQRLDVAARYPGLAGLMGNVQTPLLQFPHVSHFLNTARHYEYRKQTPRESLGDLAARLYPQQARLLVDCWLALAPGNHARAGNLARRLERLVKQHRLGRPGGLGRALFPSPQQIAKDLVDQLKLAASFEGLRQESTQRGQPARSAAAVESFLDAALNWDSRHGWSVYWKKLGTPWTLWPAHDPAYPAIVRGLRKALGNANDTTVAEFLAPIGQRLARRYDAWIVAQCALAPLREAILKKRAA